MVQTADDPFALLCWPSDGGRPTLAEKSYDRAALRALAYSRLDEGACRRIDLVAWSVELNDWVRVERFDAPLSITSRAKSDQAVPSVGI